MVADSPITTTTGAKYRIHRSSHALYACRKDKIMRVVVNSSALLLDRYQTVEMVDAAGATATLDQGCVWITMADDTRDIVLGPGQSFTIDHDGRTLVHAEAPTTLRIAEAPAHDRVRILWRRVREL